MAELFIGIDLGQRRDYTAIIVLERTRKETSKTKRIGQGRSTLRRGSTYFPGEIDYGRPAPDYRDVPVTENHFEVRHIVRLPLGVLYPQQEAAIAELYHDLKNDHEVSLAVDYTGVGIPVVDSLRAGQLPVAAVYIHGGNIVTRAGNNYNVPKVLLADTVRHLLETGRLGIASSLPEARLLIDELHGFKYDLSQSGHLKFGSDVGPAAWREAAHDDMVLATAVGCWFGENKPKPFNPPGIIVRGGDSPEHEHPGSRW